MKILAFTDTHGNDEALHMVESVALEEKPDVIIHAGDMTIFGISLGAIIKKFHKLSTKLKIPLLCIPGNHEFESELSKECRKYSTVMDLHKHSFTLKDTLFVGHGGGGFQKKYPEEGVLENLFLKKIERHENRKIVFVTHQPPYKTTLDDIDGQHAGNMTYRSFIRKAKPAVAISGHLHECFGRKDTLGECVCINPGPFGMIIEL